MARKGNFKSFEHELARRGGAVNPNSTAASIGRAKSNEVAPTQPTGMTNYTGRRRNMK